MKKLKTLLNTLILFSGIMFACQQNPVTDVKPTITTVVSPKTPSIYDYFNKTIDVKSVTINADPEMFPANDISINIGEIKYPIADVEYSDKFYDNAVDWSVSDNNIVSINKNGEFKGLKQGTVVITAKSRYKTDKYGNITVTVNNSVISVPSIDPTPFPTNHATSKIVFGSNSGSYQNGTVSIIYTVNPDGSEKRRLTSRNSCTKPKWSPDGKKILYTVQTFGPDLISQGKGGDYAPFVMDADGTNKIRLDGFLTSGHKWMPDSSRILFLSDLGNDKILPDSDSNRYDFYLVNSDGSNLKRLTNNNFNTNYFEPSPDGKKIAFTFSTKPEEQNINVIDIDSLQQSQITRNIGDINSFHWLPDSSKIGFLTKKDGKNQIYVVNADGSNITHILTDNIYYPPTWSPDGKKFITLLVRGERLNIFIANTDGSILTEITKNSQNFGYSWAPDSTKIVFSGHINAATYELYTVNADGSELTTLTTDTDGGNDHEQPDWSK